MASHPHPLKRFLRGDTLSGLIERSAEQATLTRQVRDALPLQLQDSCRHCLRAQNRLILYVDNPAQATLLRFQTPRLLEAQPLAGLGFREVSIRTLTAHTPATVTSRPPNSVPTDSPVARHLRQQASDCGDAAIQTALENLARTLEQGR